MGGSVFGKRLGNGRSGVGARHRGPVAVATVAIAAVALGAPTACLVGCMTPGPGQAAGSAEEQPAKWEPESHEVDILVPVSRTGEGIRVPLRATGTDANGDQVDKTFVLTLEDSSARGIELTDGVYDVSVAPGVISADGTYYCCDWEPDRYSGEVNMHKLSLPDDIGEGQLTATLEFCSLDEAEVTDEQISQACDALTATVVDEATVSDMRQKATAVRDSAVEEKQTADAALEAWIRSVDEAEEKAKAAGDDTPEARARRVAEWESTMHVDTYYFSVDVPSSWAGKVDIIMDSETEVAVVDKATQMHLVSFRAGNGNDTAGDVANHLLDCKVDGSRGVEMWMSDWVEIYMEAKAIGKDTADYPIEDQYVHLERSDFDRLIRLQTNGEYSADSVDSWEESVRFSDMDPGEYYDKRADLVDQGSTFYQETIFPTIRLK